MESAFTYDPGSTLKRLFAGVSSSNKRMTGSSDFEAFKQRHFMQSEGMRKMTQRHTEFVCDWETVRPDGYIIFPYLPICSNENVPNSI